MLPLEKRKLKTASYLYRTAQPLTLATFRFWGSSAGAGRIRLARLQMYNYFSFYEKNIKLIQD